MPVTTTSIPTASSKEPAKPLCFVVGPIGADGTDERKHSDWLLVGIIKHVLEAEEFGYRVKRADEDPNPGMITDHVIADILHADLVVADLTDLNANAFWELGVRHTAEKPVIHIAKADTRLPFNNFGHRVTFVDVSDYRSVEKARSDLAASARHIRTPGYKVSNPITQANLSVELHGSADPRDRMMADLQQQVGGLQTLVEQMWPINSPRAAMQSALASVAGKRGIVFAPGDDKFFQSVLANTFREGQERLLKDGQERNK